MVKFSEFFRTWSGEHIFTKDRLRKNSYRPTTRCLQAGSKLWDSCTNMAIGIGGQGGANILPTKKIKTTIYKSVYSNRLK